MYLFICILHIAEKEFTYAYKCICITYTYIHTHTHNPVRDNSGKGFSMPFWDN